MVRRRSSASDDSTRQRRTGAERLAGFGIPTHIGSGTISIVRTNQSTCLSEVLMKMRVDNEVLLAKLAKGQVAQSSLQIGLVEGKLTDRNLLDRIALQRIAYELQMVGVLPIPNAVKLYLTTRRDLQATLRSELDPTLGGSELGYRDAERAVDVRLQHYLPVARVPHFAFHESNILGNSGQLRWHNALLPDAKSIDDASFVAALEAFHDATRNKVTLDARRDRAGKGVPLSEENFADLRACVGGHMGELLEFLLCKGFDDETRRGMGISDKRAVSSITRYDTVCARLPGIRRIAENNGHVLRTTMGELKLEHEATNRRMRRLADELNLFANQAQAGIATAKRRVRDDPDVLRTLQAIVSNMGASFKGEGGFTPSDHAVLPAELDALWGTTGSQVERIHSVLQEYLADRGYQTSLAETKRLMRTADITCCKYVNKHDPVSPPPIEPRIGACVLGIAPGSVSWTGVNCAAFRSAPEKDESHDCRPLLRVCFFGGP